MSWYQCSCGFVMEMMPHFGGELVSILHVHRSARLDGTSALVSMVEIRRPFAASRPNSESGESPHALRGQVCVPVERRHRRCIG